jgi:hypothetical protein
MQTWPLCHIAHTAGGGKGFAVTFGKRSAADVVVRGVTIMAAPLAITPVTDLAGLHPGRTDSKAVPVAALVSVVNSKVCASPSTTQWSSAAFPLPLAPSIVSVSSSMWSFATPTISLPVGPPRAAPPAAVSSGSDSVAVPVLAPLNPHALTFQPLNVGAATTTGSNPPTPTRVHVIGRGK